jgi:hypothetical protein
MNVTRLGVAITARRHRSGNITVACHLAVLQKEPLCIEQDEFKPCYVPAFLGRAD